MLKIKTIACLALMVLAGVISFNANSARMYMTETYFYDDQGNIVGEEVIPCEGRVHFWGIRTQNASTTSTRCWGTCEDPQDCF